MRRGLSCNLDDIFSKVCLDNPETTVIQVFVQMNLFCDHGFGLDHVYCAMIMQDVAYKFSRMRSVHRPMDDCPASGGVGGKLIPIPR